MKLISSTSIIPLLSACLLVWSCKREPIANAEQYSKLYMPQAVAYPKVVDLIMRDTMQSIVFGAAVGGVNDQNAALQVSFKVNPALVSEFNLRNSTNYSVLPEGSYELSATEASLVAGQPNTRGLRVKIRTVGGIEPLRDYLLPVSIDQVRPQVIINDSLRTAYFKVRGTYEDFDSSKWRMVSFSSEEPASYAANAIDGKTNTVWHTQWRTAKPAHPHTIVVDMNETKSIHGFNFWPAASTTTGNPRDVTIQLSTDGSTWQDAGSFSNLTNTFVKQPVYLSSTMTARYFKIIITASTGNTHFTHPAEISAF